MDQEIRNKLRNVVTQCRKLLEDSISQELEGKYGIFAKKDQVTADPNAKMNHLSEEEQAARKDILDHFGHINARGFKPKESLDQLIREIAFTHLNRLCAYKMMEAREVYVGGQKFREAVSRGVNSNGVKFYLADHEDDERLFNTGHQDVAYRHFLDWLGGALSDEIGVLFNPNDPANRLYPRQKTLEEVLELLNEGGIKAEETELREQWPKIWSQDETIGWVYQYFTPKELRDQARKESSAPRNSYELAFRNQFFTPRYVVEFLTDNTLGRIWYEMRKGETKLKDQCRYMVRRPTEIFLKDGEQPPKDAAEGKDDLSQEELLRLPVHIPHRPKKDPRELKILDPACGSGHFLLYCFDLLLTIYEEAYADPDLGPTLKKDYPTLDVLKRDVPRLILAHNLHGIDIDVRASQIAALALWLRCQRAYQDMGFKKDRPKITRSNFVCAEPMPGEEKMLKDFVSQLEPKLLGQVVEVVFDKMKLAGEAGSLLKIEEEIRDAVTGAKKQYVRETTQATDRKGQPLLFTQGAMDRLATKPEQTSLFDLSDITDDQFFEQAEAKVIEALRQYSEKALNGQQLQRQLFTDDAVRGFAFVDLCHKRFDVVLMNPPFGEVSLPARHYLYRQLPETARDLFAGFISRAVGLLNDSGFTGAITNRTAFYSDFLQDWRRRCFLGVDSSLSCMADLGYGVLDAVVETAAYVATKSAVSESVFVNILSESDKHVALTTVLDDLTSGLPSDKLYTRRPSEFENIPDCRFAYQIHPFWIRKLNRQEVHPNYVSKAGLTSGDDFRFLRCFWEVPETSQPETCKWRWLAKGGEFNRYRTDVHLMIDWDSKDALNRTRNDELYGTAGVTYTERTTSNLSARVLNKGVFFSGPGPGVIPTNEADKHYLLAFLNSAVASYCLEAIVGGGDYSMKGTAARHLEPGYLQHLPVVELATSDRLWFTENITILVKTLNTLIDDESHPLFAGFTYHCDDGLSSSIVACYRNTFRVLRQCYEQVRAIESRLIHVLDIPDERVGDLYSDTGYPLPLGGGTDLLPKGWMTQLDCDKPLRSVDVGALPLDADNGRPRSLNRFENKLSSYLHGGVERVAHRFSVSPEAICEELADNATPDLGTKVVGVKSSISHSIGCIVGRWCIDRPVVSIHVSENCIFDELPRQQPARGPKHGRDERGIIPDDEDHNDDIVRRVREILEVIWKGRAEATEKEACEILDVKELRDYFRKPGKGGFWDDHISRYSKSRRKAPIYWLLQSSKKNYAIWLYYHRLDKDLLFKALVNYVEPKIRLETSRLEALRTQKAAAGESGKEAKRIAKDVERQEDFLSELRDFEDKLRRAANLHLEPDLNDGVVLNIAPLHELVPWKEAKSYWDELLKGEYEWSSIGKQLRQKGLVK